MSGRVVTIHVICCESAGHTQHSRAKKKVFTTPSLVGMGKKMDWLSIKKWYAPYLLQSMKQTTIRPTMQYKIIDTTLREGEQTPGVFFNDAIRKEVVTTLAQSGIDEIELGIAHPYNDYLIEFSQKARRVIKNIPSATTLSLWSRCIATDIDFAARCPIDVLSLSIPVSDLHIKERFSKDISQIKEMMVSAVNYCLNKGINKISVGFEDASRADDDFLVQMARAAADNGAFRIRLADTVGICTPLDIARMVKLVKSVVSVQVGVHCHNDFGMATANGITALKSGADWVDATILGLGERAGNSRTEEIAAFLSFICPDKSKNKRYNLKEMVQLCQQLAKEFNLPIADNHPISGKNIFTCSTGLHQHGLSVNPQTYEPYPPEMVGRKREIRISSKSGLRAISLTLEQLGMEMTEEQLMKLLQAIRQSNKEFSPKELLQLVAEVDKYAQPNGRE